MTTTRSRARLLILLAAATAALAILFTHGNAARAASTQTLNLSAAPHMVLRFNTTVLRAHPGRITIVMHNPSNSGMSHGIAVQGHGINAKGPIVAPGRNAVLTITLTTKGNYTFFCPVPGHEQAGMKGTLTIS